MSLNPDYDDAVREDYNATQAGDTAYNHAHAKVIGDAIRAAEAEAKATALAAEAEAKAAYYAKAAAHRKRA